AQIGIPILAIICIVAAAIFLTFEQRFHRAREYVFSIIIGSGCALILIGLYRMLFLYDYVDPFFVALAVLCSVVVWRLLFGPWALHVKTTVLGMFTLWVVVFLLWNDTSDIRFARLLAGVVASVPALLWCLFFLKYHVQRISMVLLMFFAGMLSTAPILFYDKLVRSGSEMQFFFFRVVPENFNATSGAFIGGNVAGLGGVQTTLIATFVSFMLVGVVEEASKFWVMRKSGRRFFSSVDDAMQLSIIVAIGFAFAENIINPSYFTGFVKAYLVTGDPLWGMFIGNVIGRAVLTNMVHIVSTGVMGYFFGLALFAGPVLREAHAKGKFFLVADGLHSILGLPRKAVFRRQMFLTGLFFAIVLHGLFNFLVTFPDLLPGNPKTIGALLGKADSFYGGIPLLLLPSLFYVVGGCWLLTELFYHKENMKERGRIVTTDTFVKESLVA
ncbi:PrsW family intramembrane metalloprotease, partial [Candidatus Peregrinibacteria bacterium]|nr:PrsW family intramembrane metalloprotease [Candidatus Peregrinibacteria bacterium]